MKKMSIRALAMGLTLAQATSITVMAQEAPTTPIIPLVGGGRAGGNVVVTQGSGTVDINQRTSDHTAITRDILKNTQGIQDADRDYVLSITTSLNAQLEALVALKKKFIELSQKPQAQGGTIPLASYLGLATDINAANDTMIAQITSKSLISRETLPSFEPIGVGDLKATINNYGNINMERVMGPIDNLRKQLIAEIDSVQFFNIVTPAAKQVINITENALNTARHIKGVRILDKETRIKYNREIGDARILEDDTEAYQQRSVEHTVNLMRDFANTYGKQEWLRFTNENDNSAARVLLKQIADAFFVRSYMRKKWGIRMGAIQTTNYKKLPVNFEDWKIQPLLMVFKQFMNQPAIDQDQVNAAFENARNFVELYDKKVTPVLASREEILEGKDKDQEFLSQNTNALIRANSALTYMTGQRQTATILRDLVILVLADIQEEMTLVNLDRFRMNELHDSKYRANEELKNYANTRMCQIDFRLSENAHKQFCVPLGVKYKAQIPQFKDGRSTQEIFARLVMQYENIEASKAQDARNMQQLLDADLESGMTDEEKEQKAEQENDLFG